MYTVKHVLIRHFSLFPSYFDSLFISSSHLICCTICAAVISRTPRVFFLLHSIPPSLPPPSSSSPGMASSRSAVRGRKTHRVNKRLTLLSHSPRCCRRTNPLSATLLSFILEKQAAGRDAVTLHMCTTRRHSAAHRDGAVQPSLTIQVVLQQQTIDQSP